jgi:GTP cyclohydrolase I
MTHKQKAEDLINSFYYALPNNGSTEGINSTTRRYQEAIRCALIAVNNMLKEFEELFEEDQPTSDNVWYLYKHYQEVKLEIQKRDDSKGTN